MRAVYAYPLGTDLARAVADAELIDRAVNSFDPMREALALMLGGAESYDGLSPHCEVARAALKLAEPKS